MADGESLLGAQLSAAVRIPYENIAVANNPANTFINAWQFATNVKLKKAELEDRMAALTMRNRQLEINDQLREREMGLKYLGMQMAYGQRANMYDLALERAANENQKIANEKELGEERIRTTNAQHEWQHQQALAREESQQALYSIKPDLINEGYSEGTQEFNAELDKRVATIAKGFSPSESNKVFTMFDGDKSAAAERQTRINEAEMRLFKQRVGSELFGNPGLQDVRPILNPEKLPDVIPPQPGWWARHLLGEKPQPPTGDKQIFATDLTTGKVIAAGTAPVKKLTDLNKEYQALLEKQSHTAKPMIRPLPADKSLMTPGLYDVPGRGTMRWTGTGLVPP